MAKKSKAKAKKVSNVERLHAAGVIVSDQFSEDEKKSVERLTAVEVSALIKLRKKHGAAPEGKHHLRPNAFV